MLVRNKKTNTGRWNVCYGDVSVERFSHADVVSIVTAVIDVAFDSKRKVAKYLTKKKRKKKR